MQVLCCSFEKMAGWIKAWKLPVIMFGAGSVGMTIAPSLLQRYDLTKYIEVCIDNDSRLWGKLVDMAGREVRVCSMNYLEYAPKNAVILLNVSRYQDILRKLDSLDSTKKMKCLIIPMMCFHNFHNFYRAGEGNIIKTEKPLIPKRIHYMWFGKNPLPQNLRRCIDSWKKHCPDYEIVRWDENNYDLDRNPYMRQAYEKGAYGFIPDYGRLDILYRYGGIYMDTDVELLRPLDPLLYQEAFCGVEKWQLINCGGCCGAMPGHRAIKALLDERRGVSFVRADGSLHKMPSGYFETKAVIRYGYQINGMNQNVLGMNIYSSDYFHPYDYMTGKTEVTENTVSIHWFNGGWLDEVMKQENRETSERFDAVYREALKSAERYMVDEREG